MWCGVVLCGLVKLGQVPEIVLGDSSTKYTGTNLVSQPDLESLKLEDRLAQTGSAGLVGAWERNGF